MRHVNDDSGIWHVANDHLAGTQIYGNHLRSTFSQSGHWTLNFEEVAPGYDEFLLATGDCSNWLMIKKDELIAHYDNSGNQNNIRNDYELKIFIWRLEKIDL